MALLNNSGQTTTLTELKLTPKGSSDGTIFLNKDVPGSSTQPMHPTWVGLGAHDWGYATDFGLSFLLKF